MRVRFWGTRGSIASPGPKTVRYGGNTSCVEVLTRAGTRIVLDAGTGLRPLGDALMADGGTRRGHLLITHTHWDHIQGFPFFTPLFQQGWEWDVYAPKGFGASLKETLAGQMQYTYFPVSLDALGARMSYHELMEGSFTIGDARVHAQYLNHPALTLGYRIEADGVSMVYATDHECHARTAAFPGKPLGSILRPTDAGDQRHCEFVAEADLLIHDSQYTAAEYPQRAGWGHSTLEYVVDIALSGRVKHLALFHHDPRREDDEIDGLVSAAKQRVRDSSAILELFAASEGAVIEIAAGEGAPEPVPADSPAREDVDAVTNQPILIACQDPQLAEQLTRVVQSEGLRAVRAGDPADAVEMTKSQSPALVFIDRDAADLCRALRSQEETSDLPIIAVGDTAAGGDAVTDRLALPFSDQYARTRLRAWLLRTRTRWMNAPPPEDEEQRLAALHRLGLLDTPPEERFDRLTRIAAQLFNVPIALISLVDRDRQWFKSRYGDVAPQTPRDQAFCAHAILGEETFVVPDALEDERFAENPLTGHEPRVRFYAGQPIATPDGHRVGTLCVADHRPRELNEAELRVLRDLAALAERELGMTWQSDKPAAAAAR